MSVTYNFAGKRVLVTGAGQGIGRRIASDLSAAGAHTIALSRTATHLNTLKEQDSRIEIVTCDLSDWESARATVESLGDIDLLVNNAGKHITCDALNATREQIDDVLDTNVKAAWNLSQIVAQNLISLEKAGAIVNVSSVTSHMQMPSNAIYGTSKAALDHLTKACAKEWASKQIRVNAVCPGFVLTNMTSEVVSQIPQIVTAMTDRTPLKRIATPENVSHAVLFLLSDASDMITGSVIDVAGGFGL